MKKWLGAITFLILVILGSWWGWKWYLKRIDPRGVVMDNIEPGLQQYDFNELRKRSLTGGDIKILGPIKAVETRRQLAQSGRASIYNFTTREISFESDGKKVSGMINYFPEMSRLSPVIIMIRGYAEKEGYYPGSGTWKVADELAKAGYTTISVDFLGYADSDPESNDMLEARFHKVVEVMDLIEAVKKLPWVDKNKIGIWAHSNGGQIALSVLEVTGEKYPTVLWAPMTNAFPDSVLDTIDEGSPVKAVMDDFQKHYDARRYAFENYYDWIKAPVLIQQGTNDIWCKVEWQQKVVKGIGIDKARLIVYDGADHNMGGRLGEIWKEAVEKDVGWYNFF